MRCAAFSAVVTTPCEIDDLSQFFPLIMESHLNRSMLDDRAFESLLRRASIVLSLALGLPLLALVGLVLFLLSSAHWVDHTDQVIAEANLMDRRLLTMQTSFRGYRLVNEKKFLNRISQERDKSSSTSSTLAALVSDNPAQSMEVASLRHEIDAWFAFLDAELARVNAKPLVQEDLTFLQRGAPLFDATQKRLDKIVAEEHRLRALRDRTLGRVIATLLVAFVIAALAGIPMLTFWLQGLLRKVSASYRASFTAAELRASELAVTLRSIGDAVVATDPEGKVNFLNPVGEALTGWTTAEAQGRHLDEVFDIFNEQTGAKTENPVARVLRENIVVGLANHTVLRSRAGREVPIEDSAAPIRGDLGQVLGVILVFHDVTEKRVVERRLKESESRLRFLNELGEATRTLAGPEEIMQATTRLLGAHLKVSRCAYAEVKEDGERFTILHDYTDGCASTVGEYQLSPFGPRAFQQMRGGTTLILRDVEVELTPEEGAGMFDAIQVKAIVCCPLLKEGNLRAMMAVHQTTPRAWTSSEIGLVEEVVERCWETIERARAETNVHERALLAALRADVAGQLDLGEPLGRTLQKCCELLVRHLDGAFARIWTLNVGDGMLILRGSAGLYTHLDGSHGRVPMGSFKIGRIAESKQPHLTNDVPRDPNISDPEWAKREGMTAFAGYPLMVEGKVLGVVAIFARHTLSEAALADLAPISDAIAQHIERKRAEAALLASENLKTAILDTSLDGFILMSHDGRIIDWNPAAERIFGRSRSDATGQLLGEMIVPERLRESHQRGLERYVATREAHILGRRYELPGLRYDGREFPCEISITHIPGTEPPIFAGYVRDISERKENEAALLKVTEMAEAAAQVVAESAERFRLLSEVVSLQFWTALPDGNLDFVNKECLEYFGLTDNLEILGQAWTQFVHPDDLPAAQTAWEKSLATGARYEVEFRLRSGKDEFRWFLVRAEAMQDAKGFNAKWFGTNTDIHDLKLAQSEAERASRAKDNFLAVLSHELRTPLTPVLMSAAALREDDRLPADVREQLGMMERNIGLEARLIDDLLDLTRIAKGKLPLRPQLCDAHSLIGLAIEIIRDEAQAKGIVLEREFAAHHSGLIADPSRFQQVIWNLLRNAVKFTPQGGSVAIRTRDVTGESGAQWLSIEVRDSGIGIAPDAIDRIFQPFEQAGLTGDHRFGGIGLGLAIARTIVDLHGGTIRAESAGKGQGAIFIVELPGATEPPAGMLDIQEHVNFPLLGYEPEKAMTTPAKALRLLLVEDHEASLQVLTRLLTRAGHVVTATDSVAGALAAASAKTFDVVISDLGLPDGTGNDLMEQLRANYGLRGIALTGYGMDADLERSRHSGFIAHLIKPVDFNQLRRALQIFQSDIQ